jgi:hypothetical protein
LILGIKSPPFLWRAFSFVKEFMGESFKEAIAFFGFLG